ncbi:MAG: ABC transporter ATP-binding protein [Xanthomonadales bacterium]|nr:putative ribonucleotide transport ATP-binding protein mkl [Xanthomonadales bacterium]MCC6593875.1 ABC transporter ATP-binding protein [Xanthomonadales bacterium]MCE7931044.1 ABC transporter ATP-binding protein [Xanthomonadales bacterium PRO6]
MSAEVVIGVRGLVNRFGAQVVHERLDLDIEKGGVLGIIGGSGTGKSVLMRSILGLQPYQAGRVWWFGQEVAKLDGGERHALERRIGVMFQDGALFSSLTVLENVMVPLKEHSQLDEHFIAEVARLKIALVGLPPDAADKFPEALSGGMRKRAGLARALALDPEVLFFDEPTSGLDPVGAAAFDELVATLHQALRLTVILITHDLDSVYRICEKIAVLADRHVIAVDTPEAVQRLDHPWIRQCFGGPRARMAYTQAQVLRGAG